MTTLRRSATTQALVDLEDRGGAVFDERLPGSSVPFWAQMRMPLATLLNEEEFGYETLSVGSSTAQALWRLGRSVLPDRSDVARGTSRRDLAFVVSGSTMHVRDGRARNWLVGDFAEALPDRSLIIQRAPLPSGAGHAAFEPTRSLDPLTARAELRVALQRVARRRRPSQADARVRELVTAFAGLLGIEDDPRLPSVIESAIWSERVRPHMEREFGRFLDRVSPRVLLYEDASYGSLYASLVTLAHSRGIVVAEPQHGWIGPAHLAYNYGATMHRPEHANTLPDTLLTFGEHWGEGVTYPGAVVSIGKPHLEQLVVHAPDLAARPREVLVVSSIAGTELTMSFIRELRAALLPDFTVRFRPHPAERTRVDTFYPGLRAMEGVVIDERPDVLDSLAACRIVVGVASTVLFEAAAFGCRVFVRDSKYVPTIVGDLFGAPLVGAGAATRVARVAADPSSTDDGRPRVDIDSLWRPDAVENFTNWFESAVERSGRPDTLR